MFSPSAPKPLPLPDPVPPAPKRADPSVQAARSSERTRARLAAGLAGTKKTKGDLIPSKTTSTDLLGD